MIHGKELPSEFSIARVPSITGAFLSTINSTSGAANANLLSAPAGTVDFDFDGDGKADIGRWNAAAHEYKVRNSNGGSLVYSSVGDPSSVVTPADFDGDGLTDPAVFKAGTWTIKNSSNGQTATINSFGQAGDIPLPGNYAGGSGIDAAVYRPSNGTWYIRESTTGNVTSTAFGAAGDKPVPGDYDGDGVMDPAVFRPSTGQWHVLGSSVGYTVLTWGVSSDTPVPADYDSDGKTDCAVYRASTGTWWIYKSSDSSYITKVWGNYGDQPVPADYDGDGKADISVWRPTTGVWYIIKSTTSQNEHLSLGVPGEKALPSAYLDQVGGQINGYDLAKARLSPINATGGTNLYSRNFAWSSSLAGLSGRGLSAGIGLSYNSLVWTKDENNAVYFDTNADNVSPGFRMGFPTIEPVFYNDDTHNFSYVMITPSGGRIEFRQVAAGDTYETADSSYARLKTKGAANPNDPVENISIEVTTADGALMNLEWNSGAFRCTRIRDRNGNYITINYNDLGLLNSVTDTLGRVITVNYDDELYPTSITQDWKTSNGSGSNQTHTWAEFDYAMVAVDTDFSGLTVMGPPDGWNLKALERVTYSDGSSTKFYYNSYAQVWKVENYAADSHLLNYVRNNLQSPSAGQTDVPRFSETRQWVENFNGGNETVVTNSFTPSSSYSLPGSLSGTATLIEVAMTGDPYGAFTRTYVGESGWMEGLPIATEDWADGTSGSERKRWTYTAWTQDDVNADTILNPRVTESRVGDTTNIKKSSTEYYLEPLSNTAVYGLVKAVNVYDTDLSTVLKRVETDYDLDTAYVSRRIIGLPEETRVYGYEGGTLPLVSKVTYGYDEEDFSYESNQVISPVQHETAYFGSSFVVGRGNLTSVTRHDVLSQSSAVTSKTRYDIAGSVVAKIDPLGRKVAVSYADSFNDSISRSSFAYPTKIYDPAGNYSEVKYRFDTGANVWAKSPAPAGNTQGKITEREYDSVGRLVKDKVINYGGAYTRYEYPTNGIQSKVYSTVTDSGSDGADSSDEILTESWADGAGRVRRTRVENPGSYGGWSGTFVDYDILGRAARQSVPTEIDSSWDPAGDDAVRGFLWTYQKYDWKGRVVRKINTDGTDSPTLNASDVLISYEGCGCAGGQITTIQGELVPRDDQPTVNARRVQKVYADILGREYKTVVMNWDGTTAYTTTVKSFNGRDQVTRVRQYAGSDAATTYQDVVMTYDGHGRMKTRHYPIEDAQTETTWNYNSDDTVSQVIDPRGAVTDMTYDTRGLTTQVGYTPPTGTAVPDTPTTTYTYDNVGNRTSMDTAGVSETTYAYDELSRLTSETVDFDDLTNNLALGYSYGLTELKTVTDPFGVDVDYTNDKTGRVTAVTGDAFGTHTTGSYASDIKYRAFGGIKELKYNVAAGNALAVMEYDDRLRVEHSSVTEAGSSTTYLLKADFGYFADGRAAAKDDLLNDAWDRTNRYDHAGRLTHNQFGLDPLTHKRMYQQTLDHDEFSNLTGRHVTYWGDMTPGYSTAFVNGRRVGTNPPDYDAAGNIVHQMEETHSQQWMTFDASGRRLSVRDRWRVSDVGSQENETGYVYDGDGRPVIEMEGMRPIIGQNPDPMVVLPNKYQVWSSVLGKSLTTVDFNENKLETQVYAGGALIATQVHSTMSDNVMFHTADPVTGTTMLMGDNGTYTYKEESEPLGQRIEPVDPSPGYPDEYTEITDIASQPNWNCSIMEKVAGGFFNMPVECQKKELELMSFSIEGALQSMEPENPSRISVDHELGHALPNHSGAAAASTETTLSTQKPPDCDETDTGDIIRICTQVPGDDGKVTVSSGDIPGFVDASESGIYQSRCITTIINALPEVVQTNAWGFVDAILKEAAGEDPRLISFSIATAIYETNGVSKRENISRQAANRKYGSKGNKLGNRPGTNDGYDFRGAGFVQLTGRGNYTRLQTGLTAMGSSIDIVNNPNMASDPAIAIQILLVGIKGNLFSQLQGVSGFSDYLTGDTANYAGARALVNGDKNQARKYLPEGLNKNKITSGSYLQTLSEKINGAMTRNPMCPHVK